MTDFFILAVAVMAAVIVARLLIAKWQPIEDEERDAES